ncbi:MAG: hypothetical protein HFI33_03700 [Lachnospiraceae bacterium]|nr:hypothetical protein [Lachnospiraceae bacterium]
MEFLSTEEKLERHHDYWQGKPQKRPLTAVRLGDVFFNRQLSPSIPLLDKGGIVTPEMFDVEAYMPEYLRIFHELEQIPQDAFFSAAPLQGFPWMEAIMGAQVMATHAAFVTHKTLEDVEQLGNVTLDRENPWYQLYLQFCRRLDEVSEGQFAVGQPILRGVTDTTGALIGQTELIMAMVEEEKVIPKVFREIMQAQRALNEDQHRLTSDFYGGRVLGFYDLWAPGDVIWYQEDLAALMSPKMYQEYLFEIAQEYIKGYEYTLVHLHPNTFFNLEEMLKVPDLKIIQINKDNNGPTVREMVPEFLKVLEAGKKLDIGMAYLDQDDIDALYDCLPSENVAITLIAPTVKEAVEVLEYMDTKRR